jgi:hypothetical protein
MFDMEVTGWFLWKFTVCYKVLMAAKKSLVVMEVNGCQENKGLLRVAIGVIGSYGRTVVLMESQWLL